jgi:Tol biopolymer transport system component/tRNA A-37 threonylcarbamoyl transferase component Bud32
MTMQRLTTALADRYRIERELGQGGMATVYLAQDLKHDRQVAIKVLRPELAAVIGAERFLSEIKTTANLQHPHILPLHDSGAADSFLYYVMPFIEGESLRDRLNREKQLPVQDAVRIATEVAGALDYAHRRGVIHRDIKPENILLHDGRALVADFGIALAASKAGGTRMTETGMSLGTPHYMSPEQAMGEREITARSDVYALGAVTYELLLGEPPFTGPTAQAIVAKVMTAEPVTITGQRRTVPPHVEAAVFTALEKLPADRFATAAEFAQALNGGAAERRYGGKNAGPHTAVPPFRRSALVGWSVAVLALGLAAWSFSHRAAAGGPSVYDAALPAEAPMTFAFTAAANAYGTPLRNLSVAPNGTFAVYVAPQGDSTTMLWYRSLRDATVRPIPATTGATAPRISPDGNRVAFFVGGAVLVAPLAGGEARRLFTGQAGSSLNWLSADTIMVLHQDGTRLALLDAEAGKITDDLIPTRCSFGRWIAVRKALLCDWNSVAYFVDPVTGKQSGDMRVHGPDGTASTLLRGTSARVVDDRYLVYIGADGDLRAAPYDPGTDLVGRPVSLVNGVRREGVGEAHFEITDDGTLVYAPGRDATVGRLVRLRAGGTPEPLPVPEATFQRFDLSPDGRWLVAAVLATDGQELRVYDLRDGQQQTWLKADYIRHPLWSPAGDALVVSVRDSNRWSILSGSLSSGRLADTLFTTDSVDNTVDAVDYISPSEVLLQHWEQSKVLQINPQDPHANPREIIKGDARFGSVSPDGRHLAYQTVEGNRIVVTSYPVTGRRWQVASEGAEPLWLASNVLLYRSGISWYQVRIDPATGEPAGPGTLWARDPRFSDTSGWSNRPSHDGGIVYVQGPAETRAGYLRIIPNWVAQMKAAVDAAN